MEFATEKKDVLWTKDYDEFTFLESNRVIDEKHLRNKILPSLQKEGWLDTNPMLVDGNFAIRDGQHRFLAAKQLGIEIPVRIVENFTDEMMFAINNASKAWTEKDKLRHKALMGDKPSQKLLFLVDKYNTGVRTAARAANRDGKAEGLKDFVVSDAENKLVKALDICEKVGQRVERLILAAMQAIETRGYNHKQMIDKLSRQKDRIHQCNSIAAYAELLNDVYNYRQVNKLELAK